MTTDFQGQRIDLAKEGNFRLGGLSVRPSTREIESGGKVESLQPRIMQVLIALVRRNGHVVSRDDLIELCWEGRVVGDDALNRCIQQLRKLGESSQAFRLETVPKVGYRLLSDDVSSDAASLTETDSPSPPSGSQILSREATEAPSNGPRPRWVIPVAAAAVLLLAAAVVGFGTSASRPIAGRIAYFGIDASPEDKEALAVAAATSSDILSTFTALQRDVAASTATNDVPAGDRVGRALALSAQYVISGTTSRQGDAISVLIRVEDARSRTALWSESFQGSPLKPAAIASRVAALLNDRMICVIKMRASLRTDDMRIVSLLPKACESIRSISPGNAERWSKLVELAPNSAWVHSGQASALFFAIPDAPPTSVDSLQRRAYDSVSRAEQIDANDPDVRLALVFAARHRGASMLELEQLFLKGLALAEHGANLNGNFGGFLGAVGRSKEGLRFSRRAWSLDPLSAPKLTGMSESLAAANALGESEQFFTQLHARYPDDGEWQSHVTAALFHGVGDIDAILHDPPPSASRLSIACVENIVRLVRLATPGSLREAARSATECGEKGALQPARADHLRALLGDFEFIFARGSDDSRPLFNRPYPVVSSMRRILFDPSLARLRSDPRFASLTEHLGLYAYWRDSNRMPDFCAVEQAPVCAQLAGKL